jgi:hypothetical protein
MNTESLFPDAPALVMEGDQRYIPVSWERADALRAALSKCGCPTTLCLDPETRQARLELWPGVTAEAVRAVLAARRANGRETGGAAMPAVTRGADPRPEPVDVICI